MIFGPTVAAAAISSIGAAGSGSAGESGAFSAADGSGAATGAAGFGGGCPAAVFGFDFGSGVGVGGGCESLFVFGAAVGFGAGGSAGSRLPPADEGLIGATTSGSKTRLPPVSTPSPGSKLRCSAGVGAGAAGAFGAALAAGFWRSAAGVRGFVGDFA